MERVIVTVKRADEARVRDLDVPAGIGADELADVIASALHWDRDSSGKKNEFAIQADPPGRKLRQEETLLSAGVRDGAWLTFIQEGRDKAAKIDITGSVGTETPGHSRGPIQGWKALEGIITESDSKNDQENDIKDDNQSPYIWKEVDL